MTWGGCTLELPPPATCGVSSAATPITAIEVTFFERGRIAEAFFRSTTLFSAARSARFACAGVVALAYSDPWRGWVIRPWANIGVNTARTAALRYLRGRAPDCTR